MRFLVCLTAFLGAIFSAPADAQQWPTRPVRFVIGFPPGSGSDGLARGIAQGLTMMWGQPVLVENRPGASTIVAAEMVARSAPDGYTLMFAFDQTFTYNPYLHKTLPYDPFKDFQPIIVLCSFATNIVTNPKLPVNSLPDLVSYARSNPGKVTYSSIGPGSQMYLLSSMLANKAGIQLVHVAYRGIQDMTTAVLSGEVDFTYVGVFTSRPLVADGRLKALAYTGSPRSRLMPNVPATGEVGYPELELPVWYGIAAPAGLPRALTERIHADVAKLLQDSEFRDRELLGRGYEPSGLGPTEFAALIRRDYEAVGKLVQVSGTKPE